MHGYSTDLWAAWALPTTTLAQTTTPDAAPSTSAQPAAGQPAASASPQGNAQAAPSTQDLISGSAPAGTTTTGANGSANGGGLGGSSGAGGAGGASGGQPQSPLGGNFMFIMIAILGFMILTTVMSGRKEKKRQAELMASLKPGDRVLAAGGLLAQVDKVKDDEVTLKIDENSSVKVKVLRSAIQQILRSSETAAETK